MIAVGLVGRVPVPAGGLKGFLGITHGAVAGFVDMKAMGPDGLLTVSGRPVGR